MRWRAKARVRAISVQIVATERARERASRVSRAASSMVLPIGRSLPSFREPSRRSAQVLPSPAKHGPEQCDALEEQTSSFSMSDVSSEQLDNSSADGIRSRPSGGVRSRVSPPASPPGADSIIDANAATRRLQATWRGVGARQAHQLWLAKMEHSAAEEKAAHVIQGMYHSRRSRKRAQLAREAHKRSRAAIVVQRCTRSHQAREAAASPQIGVRWAKGLVIQSTAPAATMNSMTDTTAPATTVRLMRDETQKDSFEGRAEEAEDTSLLAVESTRLSAVEDSPPSRRNRTTVASARASALELLASRGHRDRKSGTWAVEGSEEDAKEPGRTERLLAAPFALSRAKPIDDFQSREGFFMFRVNGGAMFGRWYRIIVIALNMTFGLLSGLQPSLPEGSVLAMLQTGLVLVLQLSMATLSFHFLPDADRIVSRFASTQFLLEGLSTMALLLSSIISGTPENRDMATAGNASDSNRTTGGAASAVVAHLDASFTMREIGFVLAVAAMLVPMLQLLEQRFITPCIGVVINKGGNPLALLAAAYMLAVSLPRKVTNLVNAFIGREQLGASTVAESATADAGDDAMEAELNEPHEAKLKELDPQGDHVSRAASYAGATHAEALEEYALELQDPGTQPAHTTSLVETGGASQGAPSTAEPLSEPSLMAAGQVADAAVRASRLLARALAAKEATGKKMAAPVPLDKTVEEEAAAPDAPDGLSLGGVRAVAQLRKRQEARKRSNAAAEEDAADGGDDDGD